MNIGIIGGGLMGLSLALRLTGQGHRVTVLEREQQLGGLTTHHDFGPFVWDRFYHVILPSDRYLVAFIEQMGLASELRWKATRTGFYVDREFYSLSSNIDFVRFPLLSLLDKARLAWTILYGARINDWRRLERISAEDWLVRNCGRATFEKMWRPLLLAKLGSSYERVSAVFIWSYIKRLFSARIATAQKEQLGHVRGGYHTVFRRIEASLEHRGGSIERGVEVTRIGSAEGGGLAVTYSGHTQSFDKVICTSPVDILAKLAAPELVHIEQPAAQVEYLGVICMVLVTTRAMTPYYVLNIADESIPFTGIIGMSNVVDTSETAGLHLTYLPKYVLSDDPLLGASDEALETLFAEGIRRIYPDFDWTSIESMHLNRARRVQPLQVMKYSERVRSTRTLHPDFFVLNTAQFVNDTLNNNGVIRAVDTFVAEHHNALAAPAQAPRSNAA